jgi:hypothetical protein
MSYFTVLAAFALASWYAWQWIGMEALETERPFVYRQFVPLAAGGIRALSGLPINQAVVVVIVVCSVTFVFAARYLYNSFYATGSLHADRFALLMAGLLFLLAAYPKHTYDVPTAMFFTLALALLKKGRFKLYAWLFPLVCLNRETAILLTVLFAVYFYRRLDRRVYWIYMGYQTVVYVLIRLALMWIFAGEPGQPFYFRPMENWKIYTSAIFTTNIFLLFVIAVGYILFLKWRSSPALMRSAFLVFTPLLAVSYLLLGVSFEIRVFIELLPVVGMIAASPGS